MNSYYFADGLGYRGRISLLEVGGALVLREIRQASVGNCCPHFLGPVGLRYHGIG